MSARILIIEDNSANLELMTYLLKAFGHLPAAARNGAAGLIAARKEKPDLVVCDIQLPDTDGYAIARELKAEASFRSVPLIAVTALAMVGDREKALVAGFDGYISKPIDPESFVRLIEGHLGCAPGAIYRQCDEPTSVALEGPQCKATVLVVDDLPINLKLKKSILEPLGYTVFTAPDAIAGVETARRIRPDLIISDLQMANGNGFEFLATLKADALLKTIPFMFVTATYCDDVSRAKGLALGATRFLFRPIEPRVLVAEIQACLGERQEV